MKAAKKGVRSINSAETLREKNMKKQTTKKSTDRFRKIPNPQIFTEEEISLSNAKVNIHIRLESA